ncbi:MAG: two-component sensor histidine kinase, partial [Clostridia bacterium]|nr:two-component sensor histidine kinase [Clostridia bacterium]
MLNFKEKIDEKKEEIKTRKSLFSRLRRVIMSDSMAQKLMFYFFLVILIFALIISAAFTSIFNKELIDSSREELEARTVAFSKSLSNYLSTPGVSSVTNFSAYLKVLTDTSTNDVWIIDDTLEIFTAGNNTISYNDLPKSAQTIVTDAFSGKTVTSEGFTSVLKTSSVTVATPIYRGKYVIGVMVMHSPVSGMNKMATNSLKIFLICIIGALLISLIPAVLLSKRFTNPIILKEAEEKLKLEQMRRDYVANISHELKTPVTVLRGSLEALVDGVITEEEDVKEYHQQMLHETVYLQRLVLDLLDLSRLQNTGFEIQHEPVSLTQVLDDAIKSGEKLAQEKNIVINKSYNEPKDAFVGDYGRLRQMFIIILDNAVKFSNENSSVDVIFSSNRIHIRDYGCGIEPERLPYIFERFHKSGGENNKTGSGLGLAIAREIAHRHNIKVSARSAVGEGTEF